MATRIIVAAVTAVLLGALSVVVVIHEAPSTSSESTELVDASACDECLRPCRKKMSNCTPDECFPEFIACSKPCYASKTCGSAKVADTVFGAQRCLAMHQCSSKRYLCMYNATNRKESDECDPEQQGCAVETCGLCAARLQNATTTMAKCMSECDECGDCDQAACRQSCFQTRQQNVQGLTASGLCTAPTKQQQELKECTLTECSTSYGRCIVDNNILPEKPLLKRVPLTASLKEQYLQYDLNCTKAFYSCLQHNVHCS